MKSRPEVFRTSLRFRDKITGPRPFRRRGFAWDRTGWLPLLAGAIFLILASIPLRAQSSEWDIEKPTGPTRSLSFEASEGTYMSVDISPDGRMIAFDLLGTIYEMPFEGGTATALTSGNSWNLFPRYSPDGSQIAFSSDRSGSHNIWVLERDSGRLRNISKSEQNIYRPTWSRDGRWIYAGAPRALAVYGINGGSQVLVEGSGPLNGAFQSPNQDVIYYEHHNRATYPFEFNPYVIPPGGARIERLNLETGEKTVVVERPGGAFQPTLSPDGSKLAYLHRSLQGTVLMLLNLATRRDRQLLSGLDRDRQDSREAYGPYPNLAWHPDGQRLLVTYGGKMHLLDTQSGEVQEIPFRAPVRREMSQTIRFRTTLPTETARTRTHRWGSRTPEGILFEVLGDIWLQNGSEVQNLTQSDLNETSPIANPKTGDIFYAAWSDNDLGAVYRRFPSGEARRLTLITSQYGSLALSPDGRYLAYVRGMGGLHQGMWLSNQTQFELIVQELETGTEHRVTGISGQELQYANIAGKIPPSVRFGEDGEHLFFSEFEDGILVLKRIRLEGSDETLLYKFPNAVDVKISPDFEWMAIREYHRSFITPFAPTGSPQTISAYDHQGFTARVDREDGGYLTWSSDGRTLCWTRGSGFYEKAREDILAEARQGNRQAPTEARDWLQERVPGSTARRTELAIEFDVRKPSGTTALTGVRVITMNPQREVLENATILIEGDHIAQIGSNVPIPSNARVFDLAGDSVIPGIVDAHAHPHIENSSLHVIEQNPTYFRGPLAYGVTTMMEVYGNEYRDGWLSDMLRAGKMTGPRYLTTGSSIYGSRTGRRRMFRPIETLDDAREQLRWNKDHGAIAVKDYAQSTRKRRNLTITAARELELNVVSESSSNPQMNLTQILDGVTGIEHSMGLTPFYDDIIRFWGGTDAGMTPTLLVVYNGPMGEGWYHQTTKLWEDPKLTRFISPISLNRVRRSTHIWPEDMYAWEMAAEVKKLYEAGTSLQLGAHGQMLGLGTHWELELFQKGGFSPAQILEIATIRGATHHGLDRQLGSLEIGKLADLVILSANPLEDIRNVRSIRYVMKNGILYSGDDAARVWPDPAPAPKPYFKRQ